MTRTTRSSQGKRGPAKQARKTNTRPKAKDTGKQLTRQQKDPSPESTNENLPTIAAVEELPTDGFTAEPNIDTDMGLNLAPSMNHYFLDAPGPAVGPTASAAAAIPALGDFHEYLNVASSDTLHRLENLERRVSQLTEELNSERLANLHLRDRVERLEQERNINTSYRKLIDIYLAKIDQHDTAYSLLGKFHDTVLAEFINKHCQGGIYANGCGDACQNTLDPANAANAAMETTSSAADSAVVTSPVEDQAAAM